MAPLFHGKLFRTVCTAMLDFSVNQSANMSEEVAMSISLS